MLLNYLKLALRLLVRNPFFTFINVLGLSLGFAVFFVLWQYSQSELKSEQFHQDWERIYRFGMIAKWTDDTTNWESSPVGTNDPLLTSKIAREYHQVEAFTTLYFQPNFLVGSGRSKVIDHDKDIYLTVEDASEKRSFLETKIAYADTNFLNFFSIPLVKGNRKNIFSLPQSVVLSENVARKYFGEVDPVGKTLLLNDQIPLQVSGVFENLPPNTHLSFDILISMERIRHLIRSMSNPWEFYCYVKLKPLADPGLLSHQINEDLKETIKDVAFGTWPHGTGETYLQPLKEISFVNYRQDFHRTKSQFFLTLLSYVSLIILAMAWINYINLTISANRKRMKEVEARRTVGARRGDFILQFIAEAALVNLISFLLAVTLVQLSRGPAELLFQFYVPDWKNISSSAMIIVGITLVSGILVTGLYPAIIALKQSPRNLFGPFRSGREGLKAHIVLTTFQFCIATVLLVWIFTVFHQISFVLDKDIGIAKEQVVVVDLPVRRSENFRQELNSLVAELSSVSSIRNYTVSQSAPGDGRHIGINFRAGGRPGIGVDTNGGVDEHFIPFYYIKLIAGRNFLSDHPSDSNSVIISESTAHRLGFIVAENALGENIHSARRKVTVIGIMKDYKIRPSLTEGYLNYGGDPGLALTYKDYAYPLAPFGVAKRISLRISPGQFSETLEGINRKYNKFFPGQIFNWYFLDEVIHSRYEQQKTARNQILVFTVLAIGIACLGLLGMISNKAVEKTKEIGIRKVLGARLHEIGQVLLRGTVLQATVAIVIGIPVAWYLTTQYLENFSERITIQWWHLALPVMILVAIMFATVASVVWKAARSNPVEALKYE